MAVKGEGEQHTEPVRVFVVEDHPIMREGIELLVNEEPDMTICGNAERKEGAVEKIKSARPDVAVVDLVLPGRSGLDLIEDLRDQCPEVKIIVLSAHDEQVYAERALHAGAMGYVMKQEHTRKLLEGIRTVLKGEVYVSEQMSSALLRRFVKGGAGADPGTPADVLSDRELQVFRLLGKGLTTREVAEKLKLSVKTIETYREHIKRKLNLKNANQLLQRAIQWVGSESDF